MDFEKLGVFYLGRTYDLATRKSQERLLLYDSKDLVTHAVCVGMTGSGKTGLCIALLEEAAIDGIPAIAIDPKGARDRPSRRRRSPPCRALTARRTRLLLIDEHYVIGALNVDGSVTECGRDLDR
jgi:hypothetical protein